MARWDGHENIASTNCAALRPEMIFNTSPTETCQVGALILSTPITCKSVPFGGNLTHVKRKWPVSENSPSL
ncbi:hypothetical protein K7432_011350 [Basidiobolus ranarum]|uniref:Uncharacterized protein n=1 Tax=Basidiobolus ranarum TaxID=34480 RepID=A0ABR2WMJ4_9FUNG